MQYFIKQLFAGTKKYIHSNDVKPLPVPYYKGLSMKLFWEIIDSTPDVLVYFPDPKDRAKIPRSKAVVVSDFLRVAWQHDELHAREHLQDGS